MTDGLRDGADVNRIHRPKRMEDVGTQSVRNVRKFVEKRGGGGDAIIIAWWFSF